MGKPKVHLVLRFVANIPIVACGVLGGQDSSAYRKHVTCKRCLRREP